MPNVSISLSTITLAEDLGTGRVVPDNFNFLISAFQPSESPFKFQRNTAQSCQSSPISCHISSTACLRLSLFASKRGNQLRCAHDQACASGHILTFFSTFSLARCRKQCFSPNVSRPSSLKAPLLSCKPYFCFLPPESSSAAPPHHRLQLFARKPPWPARYGTSTTLSTTALPPSPARPSLPLPPPARSATPRKI